VARDNQSITRETRRQGWHNNLSPRFTCLPVSYVLIVAIHLLGGSRASRHHMPNPQSGAAQPTQDYPQAMSNLLEFLLALHQRKGQEPLTITTIRAKDKHLPPLDDPRCTKQSRWWQLPRLTSESNSETQSPSASRCNHSKQCT
jgi:hypothetical protein